MKVRLKSNLFYIDSNFIYEKKSAALQRFRGGYAFRRLAGRGLRTDQIGVAARVLRTWKNAQLKD